MFHAPVALYPTPFPKDVFEFAKEITPKFAELYDKVSEDDTVMRETLREAALATQVYQETLENFEASRETREREIR